MKGYIKNYKRRTPLFRFLIWLLRRFSKKLKIINLNEGELEQNCIFISNHSAANGPFKLFLHFPYSFSPWGINDMCRGYMARRRYLIYTFYRKKLKYGKLRSHIIGTLFALISAYLYRNVGVIPTFEDSNLKGTVDISIKKLENGENILIFPEDSSNGYFEVLNKYYPGFVLLSKMYFKKHKIDLPVYPIYISKKDKVLIIGKQIYLNKLLDEGMTLEKVAEHCMNVTNTLYSDYLNSK